MQAATWRPTSLREAGPLGGSVLPPLTPGIQNTHYTRLSPPQAYPAQKAAHGPSRAPLCRPCQTLCPQVPFQRLSGPWNLGGLGPAGIVPPPPSLYGRGFIPAQLLLTMDPLCFFLRQPLRNFKIN